MRHALLVILLSFASATCFATAQIPDTLLFLGETAPIYSAPLLPIAKDKQYYSRIRPFLGEGTCSASWHGFRANWSIERDQLILLSIQSEPCSDSPKAIPLGAIFIGRTAPLIADWYTGRVILPRGEILKHDLFSGRHLYERYRVFQIERGLVVSNEELSQLPP
ncbi:hypothetical protein [Roseateles oligotrophus]|uniref:Lipoprotein n=1 Tax=Roseateles oligotrophus TaxID=1769250 RepID=A0ABT2YJ28_9BURK|nr:hypothetical protein [Roseateles oligotrophus]MCV2370053.1 hypothetical protein [Roseateles oligotrophus]